MFEKITAIAAAAACAGLIVAFAPGFAPEVVAGTSQPVESSVTRIYTGTQQVEFAASAADFRKAAERNHNGSRDTKIICDRPWPYYDRSCLRDHPVNAGAAHAVRVIANDQRGRLNRGHCGAQCRSQVRRRRRAERRSSYPRHVRQALNQNVPGEDHACAICL